MHQNKQHYQPCICILWIPLKNPANIFLCLQNGIVSDSIFNFGEKQKSVMVVFPLFVCSPDKPRHNLINRACCIIFYFVCMFEKVLSGSNKEMAVTWKWKALHENDRFHWLAIRFLSEQIKIVNHHHKTAAEKPRSYQLL